MNNAYNAGQSIGSVLGDLALGDRRAPGKAYYDALGEGYEIQGKKSRAELNFEDAARSRSRNIARDAITADLIAAARSGDKRQEAELARAMMLANETLSLGDYARGALGMRELGVRDRVQAAAEKELGVMNGGLASLANAPIEVNTIDDGYQVNKYLPGGAAIPTAGKVADINKTNREFYDNGSGVFNVDFATNSATPITVGPMPELGDVQNQYAELGAKHGFQTTSIGRTPEGNARANGVKNSQHLGDSPTARDWSIRGKSPQAVQAFLSDLRGKGYEAFVHDAGSGPHVHAELPPGSRRGTPSLLTGKPGGGTSDKAPSGYRFKADGNLEAIPGGPADKAGRGGGDLPELSAGEAASVRKQHKELKDALGAFKAFDAAVSETPNLAVAQWDPAERGRLGTAYNNARSYLRVLYNTGVLQPGELPMLEKALRDPNGAAAFDPRTRGELRAQLDELYGLTARTFDNLTATYPQLYNQDTYARVKAGGELGAPAVTRVRSATDYNALPSGATYIDPNGVQRRKP